MIGCPHLFLFPVAPHLTVFVCQNKDGIAVGESSKSIHSHRFIVFSRKFRDNRHKFAPNARRTHDSELFRNSNFFFPHGSINKWTVRSVIQKLLNHNQSLDATKIVFTRFSVHTKDNRMKKTQEVSPPRNVLLFVFSITTKGFTFFIFSPSSFFFV